MTVRCFVDTNLFIYLFDRGEADRREKAIKTLSAIRSSGELALSFQVLNEFQAVARRRFTDWPQTEMRAFIADLVPACTAPFGPDILPRAWEVQDQYGFSFWDALIVASAALANCRFLVSEDLQNGQQIGGCLVINPFVSDFEAALAQERLR